MVDLVVTEDQDFFRTTTRKFFERECPLTAVRELARSDTGFDRDAWRQGAALGWTSLLVPEELGGGTVSDDGMVDLACLADLFGTHVAPGPLLPTNVVAGALARSGSAEQQADLLPGLLGGDAIASWAHMERGGGALTGELGMTAVRDGEGYVLRGAKEPVEAGAEADVLLVTAATDDGPVQLLVDAHGAGITVTPLESIDMVRRFARVEFADARVPSSALLGAPGGTRADIDWQLQVASVVQCAEMVGAAQVAFDLTRSWAFDRYTFGRPLASYQAIKHRFADMKLWLEASHAIAAAAATEVGAQRATAAETASIAKAYTGDHLTELVQDCIQIHGGIGLTYEHDLHLFLRRIVADRLTYGTPAEHRLRIADFREHIA
jgi:alkylation response protein AidB-like acyl-CoA dehydrogenase